MEEKITFERFLFGDGNEIIIDDMEFCIDRIVMLPKMRPLQLEKAVMLSFKYCQIADFCRKILAKSNECPVLIHKLFKRGVFIFKEIEPFLIRNDTFLLCYYFRREIDDFNNFIKTKDKIYPFNQSFFENESYIDQLIEFGFLPSSVEYCLKYDVVDDLVGFDKLNQKAIWSPFEWSYQPKYDDLFSFAGYFGSIKCFKYLLMKGFKINENVLSMVVCGGCFDLYHLCQGEHYITPILVCEASKFSHLQLLVFMLENGCDINAKGEYNYTPLHRAAQYGHLSVVEYLVNQKADINSKDRGAEFLY